MHSARNYVLIRLSMFKENKSHSLSNQKKYHGTIKNKHHENYQRPDHKKWSLRKQGAGNGANATGTFPTFLSTLLQKSVQVHLTYWKVLGEGITSLPSYPHLETSRNLWKSSLWCCLLSWYLGKQHLSSPALCPGTQTRKIPGTCWLPPYVNGSGPNS